MSQTITEDMYENRMKIIKGVYYDMTDQTIEVGKIDPKSYKILSSNALEARYVRIVSEDPKSSLGLRGNIYQLVSDLCYEGYKQDSIEYMIATDVLMDALDSIQYGPHEMITEDYDQL